MGVFVSIGARSFSLIRPSAKITLAAYKRTHWYRAAPRGRSDCFFVRNTGRTDDAVVIMVIMMQQHTNIYKLHLAARLTASRDRDYVTHKVGMWDAS